MDLQWLTEAYEAANRGDWTWFANRADPGYRHHVPSLGITWDGVDQSLQGLRDTYAAMDLTQSAKDVVQHGGYVVASITGRSNLRPEPFDAVHVFRLEGDQLAEGWMFYPPIA